MNNRENNYLDGLKGIDEFSAERLSEKYPYLDSEAKKRILEKCLEKTGTKEFDDEVTVYGTEEYRRPMLSRIIGIAAALVVTAAAAGSAVYLTRNRMSQGMLNNESSETEHVTMTSSSTSTTMKEDITSTATSQTETTSHYSSTTTDNYTIYTTSTSFESTITASTTSTDSTSTTSTETTSTTTTSTESTDDETDIITTETLAGFWNTSDNRTFEFYSDGSGGKFDSNETGTGLGFSYSIDGDIITFRFAHADAEPEPARISFFSHDHFILYWDNGQTESFERSE